MKIIGYILAILTVSALCGGNCESAMDTTGLRKPQNALYYIHNATVNFNTKAQKERAHRLIFTGEDFPLAISILNKIIDIDKNDSEAYILRAVAYHETKKYYQADDDYKNALMLEPENPTFYYMRGMNYLYGLKNSYSSMTMFRKALQIEPNYINAMVGMGDAYYSRYNTKNDYNQAIEWYNKVLVLYPNHEIVLTKKEDAQEKLRVIEEEIRKNELRRRIG